MGYRTVHKPQAWHGRVTLCVDERRVRYCANQLLHAARAGTRPHLFAREIIYRLNQGTMPDAKGAYLLEKLYREDVLQQRTSGM